MSRIVLAACATAALLAGAATDAGAAETTGSTTHDIAERLTRLDASLDRIASALDALLEGQRVDVMLKRIELADRRIEPLERALRSARDGVESLDDELQHMQAMSDELRTRMDQQVRENLAPDEADRDMARQIERQIELMQERRLARERVVRDLEDDLARRREAIEILDDTLRDMLER